MSDVITVTKHIDGKTFQPYILLDDKYRLDLELIQDVKCIMGQDHLDMLQEYLEDQYDDVPKSYMEAFRDKEL